MQFPMENMTLLSFKLIKFLVRGKNHQNKLFNLVDQVILDEIQSFVLVFMVDESLMSNLR